MSHSQVSVVIVLTIVIVGSTETVVTTGTIGTVVTSMTGVMTMTVVTKVIVGPYYCLIVCPQNVKYCCRRNWFVPTLFLLLIFETPFL